MCTPVLQRHELTPFPSNASLLWLWAYDFLGSYESLYDERSLTPKVQAEMARFP